MEPIEIERFRLKLKSFLADLLLHTGRRERRRNAEDYVHGLLSNGARKSVSAIAHWLPECDVQSLQQFLSQSPWPFQETMASLARKLEGEFVPEAYWIIHDVCFPKRGKHSVGVARQFPRSLEKKANCQVAVTLNLGVEESIIPLDWKLYLPEEWVKDLVRRRKAGIPQEIRFKSKPELALDLIDEVRDWGLTDRLVLAESGYGDSYEFRQGLQDRRLDYFLQVDERMMGRADGPHRSAPTTKRSNEIPRKHLQAGNLAPSRTLQQIAKDIPMQSWKKITWREGTRRVFTSYFARGIVWLPNGVSEDKTLSQKEEELLIERPNLNDEPSKFWVSSLSARTSWRSLVKKIGGSFQIEQDYHEMKMRVGLAHFQGRSWQGWYHHIALATIAYTFLLLERLENKRSFWIDITSCPPIDPRSPSCT